MHPLKFSALTDYNNDDVRVPYIELRRRCSGFYNFDYPHLGTATSTDSDVPSALHTYLEIRLLLPNLRHGSCPELDLYIA